MKGGRGRGSSPAARLAAGFFKRRRSGAAPVTFEPSVRVCASAERSRGGGAVRARPGIKGSVCGGCRGGAGAGAVTRAAGRREVPAAAVLDRDPGACRAGAPLPASGEQRSVRRALGSNPVSDKLKKNPPKPRTNGGELRRKNWVMKPCWEECLRDEGARSVLGRKCRTRRSRGVEATVRSVYWVWLWCLFVGDHAL